MAGRQSRPAVRRTLVGKLGSPDPVVAGSAALAVFALSAFVVGVTSPHAPLVLLWVAPALSPLIPMVSAARIARSSRFVAATRRLWRHLAACAALVSVGAALNAHDAISDERPTQQLSPVTVAAYGCAILVLLWGLWRLPIGADHRGDRLRIGLDAGTVMLAAAVFAWHFQTWPLLHAGGWRAPSLIGAGFTSVLELVTVFAIAKVALSGPRAYVAQGALRLFALGLILGGFSGYLQRFMLDRPQVSLQQITVPVVMICATAAARRQWAEPAPKHGYATNRRPLSVLPYLAVAAVDVLLLAAVAVDDGDRLVVAVAAVGVTAVVTWRQIAAFHENTRLLARLDHNATHDALTQLPNRALFNRRLAAAVSALEPSRRVSVALIDLDDFKIVNDTLGHGTGDALLVAVARRLESGVRRGDMVARLGGDEFVVVLDDITAEEAEHLVQGMIAALAEPVLADGHDLLVRVSIGIAEGRSGDEPGELLRRADVAMYAAKHTGGSNWKRFVPGMEGAVAGSAALGAQLRRAIDEGELFLQYQPIVSLADGRLNAVEALVRWAHPDRGTVPPAEFIAVAERTGLIVPLGQWVLREACRQLAVWTRVHAAAAPSGVHVNVSARQLAELSFTDQVVAVLLETGVAPHRLTIEITETTAVGLGEAVTHLERLRRIGVRVSLDDFGTDQSSLTLLQDLPIDELKLDRSFVQHDGGGRRGAMAAAILMLTQLTDLDIVAEGVERPDQAERLAALGYRNAQGYHFAAPMGPEAISRLIATVSTAGVTV